MSVILKALNSVPKCLKILLSAAGYDTSLSLSQIDEEKIVDIENFLNTNKRYVGKLKCCYSKHYKDLEIFKFLPGHKAILKTIPSQIEELSKRTVAVKATTKKRQKKYEKSYKM